MGFEVELKFQVADPTELERKLADRGATNFDAVDHEDVYFAHPSRDFAATGEAFRIRGEGTQNRITYKGAKLAGPTKTREEIELGFGSGMAARDDLRLIFERLGFTVVATVRKRRRSYDLSVGARVMTVVIDHVDSLGDFAEVETLVADDADLASGQRVVVELAQSLGLANVESRSYLRMVLEVAGQLPRNSSGQT